MSFFSLCSQAHSAKRISSDELKLLVKDWLESKGIQDAEPKFKKGIIDFLSDSDAFISKGMVTILSEIYGNKTPKEIISQTSG